MQYVKIMLFKILATSEIYELTLTLDEIQMKQQINEIQWYSFGHKAERLKVPVLVLKSVSANKKTDCSR